MTAKKKGAKKAPAKTAKKTAKPRKVPQPNGRGALYAGGVPGNKGGRPPNEHREWCQRLVSSRESEEAVQAVLGNPQHPAFAAMWKAVTDRAYGKASQSLEVSGPAGGAIPHEMTITRRIVRADVDA